MRSREGHAAEELIRACWLFALRTEVYRTGMRPGSPLMVLGSRTSVSAELLLGLAPDVAVEEMQALHLLAAEHLYPRVPVGASLALGPTFASSELCNADADVIFDGCLLDIKTRLGDKTARGRSDGGACRTSTSCWDTHCSIGRTSSASNRSASTQPAMPIL